MGETYIILPTLNEEEGLNLVLKDLEKIGFNMKNVIVVDGHSTDKTINVAKKYGINVIMQEGGKGKGIGFQTFLRKWDVKDDDIYIMLDADYTYDPKEYSKLESLVKTGYDVVMGRRKIYIDGFEAFLHVLGSVFLSITASLLFFRFNPDICTGYWAFRGSALKKMKIKAKGFQLEANLFCEACKKGLKIGSVRVDYKERVGQRKLKTSDGLKIFGFIVAERFR